MKASKVGKMIGTTQFVLCKKSIETFKKGEYYILLGFYGDPQGSLEAGNEYMTTDFLNVVLLMDGLNGKPGKQYFFEWKGRKKHMTKYENSGLFQDYFVVDMKEERRKKLRSIKNGAYK